MITRFFRGRHRAGAQRLGKVLDREQYGGYELLARPIKEGSQWRVAGTIRASDAGPDSDGYDFVRADTIADPEECVRMCLAKGRKLVDEQGRRLLPGRE
jgi:hypothetical protein